MGKKRKCEMSSQWALLRPGMSAEKVQEILGTPDRAQTDYVGQMEWSYKAKSGPGSAHFDEGKNDDGVRLDTWKSPPMIENDED